jgi:leucyl aminopeptidase
MEFKTAKELKQLKLDGLIYGIYFEGDDKKPILPVWVDKKEPQLKKFFANLGEIVSLTNVDINGEKIYKVLLIGLGKKENLNAVLFSSAYASAFNALKNIFCENIGLVFDEPKYAKALASQIQLADYSFSKYKEKKKDLEPKVKTVYFINQKADEIKNEILKGQLYSKGANFARDLQNEPANIATTTFLVSKAKELAKNNNFVCKVLEKDKLKKEGLNGLLAVGLGSENPPYLVILEYFGNKKSKEFDLAIVGKGITFDSGGLSLKPSEYMEDMKFDKSGACAVLGIFSVLKQLNIKKNILGILALAENMPSSKAYRPGDIIKTYNNKTIEVVNTDAEGRIILADALSYCSKNYKPKAIVDLATLTGACVVALGDLAAGLFSSDQKLKEKLIKASEKSAERLWELPSWEEYDEKVKSQVADVKNVGERGLAGATAGYSFLKVFVDKSIPWAHLDIAGVSWLEKPNFGLSVGGTGFGVRLLLTFLEDN